MDERRRSRPPEGLKGDREAESRKASVERVDYNSLEEIEAKIKELTESLDAARDFLVDLKLNPGVDLLKGTLRDPNKILKGLENFSRVQERWTGNSKKGKNPREKFIRDCVISRGLYCLESPND